MKRLSVLAASASVVLGLVLFLMPAQAQVIVAVPPVDTTGAPLRDGDLITSFEVTDPDIYIINLKNFSVASGFDTIHQFNGAKRLFLNPTIFSFYGHLGGFANVRRVTPQVLDSFQTSGLFRNCETDDQRVWAVEVTGEDSGIFHHVQVSGAAAVLEDPNFFKKVFCINSNEERWYAKSIFPYTRLADVPRYERVTPTQTPTPTPVACTPLLDCQLPGANPACQVFPAPGQFFCASPPALTINQTSCAARLTCSGGADCGSTVLPPGWGFCSIPPGGTQANRANMTNVDVTYGNQLSDTVDIRVTGRTWDDCQRPTNAYITRQFKSLNVQLQSVFDTRYCQGGNGTPFDVTIQFATVGLENGDWFILTNGYTNQIGTLTVPNPSRITIQPSFTSVSIGPSSSNVNVLAATVQGNLPNPCFELTSGGGVEQSGNRIDVTFSATAPEGISCTQVLQPYTKTIDLHAGPTMPSGTYELYINGQFWGTFTRSFTISADDSSYDGAAISVKKGETVSITFNVRSEGVYFGGLEFRGGDVNTGTIAPGGSKTVQFTANTSFSIRAYWPASGVVKPYTISVTVLP